VDLPKLGRSDISPDKPFSFVGRGVKNTTTVGCDYFAREQAVLHKGFLELALGHLKVAQDILGHQHLETTADVYAQTDQHALVEALSAAKSHLDAEAAENHLQAKHPSTSLPNRYVFAYDEMTLQELDQVATHPSDPTT